MEQTIPVPGGRLWTASEGAGVPVVFISGGPGCCDYLEPASQPLAGVARTIRFDARGCGRSSESAQYALETSLSDLEAIRAHYGVDRWVLVGHSAGADMALLYAMTHPDRTLGFVCLSGGRIHDDRSWHAEYSRARDAGLEPDLDYAYPPNLEVNRQLNAAWKAYIKRPSLLRHIAEVQAPALFVYGDRDIRPSWPCEQVAALLPHAEFHMLPGANHNLWLTHGEELSQLLRQFLRTLSTDLRVSAPPR
ncbi:MAG: alpha/beta fold hydrolase [Tepidiformaceae bacterium]